MLIESRVSTCHKVSSMITWIASCHGYRMRLTSWGGTSNVTLRKSILVYESIHGITKNRPGPRAPPFNSRPKRKMTARSYCWTTWMWHKCQLDHRILERREAHNLLWGRTKWKSGMSRWSVSSRWMSPPRMSRDSQNFHLITECAQKVG